MSEDSRVRLRKSAFGTHRPGEVNAGPECTVALCPAKPCSSAEKNLSCFPTTVSFQCVIGRGAGRETTDGRNSSNSILDGWGCQSAE
jgi:hypothetical protein